MSGQKEVSDVPADMDPTTEGLVKSVLEALLKRYHYFTVTQ